MKYLFISLLVTLVAVSAVTFYSFPEQQTEKTVLRWAVALSPTREKQAELFEKWMEDNGYPPVELRIEGPKNGRKNVVQGVAGVAADIFDCYRGEIALFQSVGLLEDVTDVAEEMGFGPSKTYAGVWSDLAVDGRQYGFPRGVEAHVCWVNVEAFERVGLPVPPKEWSFEDFERIGKKYVELSNKPGEHQTVYFTRQWGLYEITILLRSLGVDILNETLTGFNLDTPEAKEIYTMFYRWVNDLKLIPTLAESKALSSGSSAASNSVWYLFSKGNFGINFAGRHGLMFFRDVGPEKLSISEFPHRGYRNSLLFASGPAIYKGSKHKDIALYFLKFMASDIYNQAIVEDPDCLPPSPRFAYGKAFEKPVNYPNEWGLHEQIRDMVNEIAISFSDSPYVQKSTYGRYINNAMHNMLADRVSIGDALDKLVISLENDMVRFVNESEELNAKYEKQVEDQKEIDRLRQVGEIIPLHLIVNPFYRRYYVDQGWSLPDGREAVASR
jgi:multiple sugar transport system substrate-binding protein